MKEFVRKSSAVLFDLRVVIGVCGIILSVVVHELFHIIVHWGEIRSISLFPDSHAIFEVTFSPSTEYDLVIEEALAYTITMVTLVLTALLVGEVHDVRDKKTVKQIILPGDQAAQTERELDHLAMLLGVQTFKNT